MNVLADTGPLVAASNLRDRAHGLAAALVAELGRNLIVPEPVIVEVDWLLRSRVGAAAARTFLKAMADGEHAAGFMTQGLLKRAAEFDQKYSDLDLGFVDSAVMAYAERHNLPILTFDFEDFRATAPKKGYWRLVVDEKRYLEAVR